MEQEKTDLDPLLAALGGREAQMSGRTPGAGYSRMEPVGGDLGVYTSGIDASTCGRRFGLAEAMS